MSSNSVTEALNSRPDLSAGDASQLRGLEGKLQVIRDYVGAVVKGLTTGFYLYGPPGVSKSHTVIEELERLKAPYVLYNAYLSGRGLLNVLAKHPDSIILIEDAERMFRDRGAQGVLRSALWSNNAKGREGRVVTWANPKRTLTVVFSGGLIFTANRGLDDWPELDALRTRIAYQQLAPTQLELQAQMRYIATWGFQHEGLRMTPEECLEVAEFLIQECRGLRGRPGMTSKIVHTMTSAL